MFHKKFSVRRMLFISMAVSLLSLLGEQSEKRASSRTTMPEVVVTGTQDKNMSSTLTGAKTDTPLKDIPASIQIISKELSEQQGAVSLDQTIKNASGVTQSSSSNYGFFNNYLIRGLSLVFLRDGVPDGPTVNGYARSLTNVERVEILKGPGSALYGSSAPGGTVNLVTKEPLDSPFYSIAQTFGSFDTYQTSLDFTGPLGAKNVLYRLNSAYYTSEGFRDLNKRFVEILPVLTWNPTDGHRVIFDFDYRDLDIVADTYGIPFRGRTLLDVPRDKKYYTPFGNTSQEIFRGSIRDEFEFSDEFLLRNNISVLQRNVSLMRNAGGTIAANGVTMTGRGLRKQTDDATDVVYQLEPVFKVQTGQVKQTILGGFEFQGHQIQAKRDTAALPNIANVFTPVIPETSLAPLSFTPNFNRDIEANYYSLYGQDQVEFNDQWKMRLGGRLDRFDIESFDRVTSSQTTRYDTELSWQFGLVYQPIETASFYGGISRSALALLSSESTTLASPENGTQYEIGNKTSFFDGHLNLNTALFQVVRENFLVTIGTEQLPVGEQKTQGIEWTLSSEPVKGWNLYGNYSIVEAELTDLPSDRSAQGNRPTGVPTQSASAWSTYELQGGFLKGFGYGGGMTFRDAIFIDQRNTQGIPTYATGDLVFFYRRDPVEVQFNIYNVSDETYFRNGVNSGALPGDPLSFQGTIRVKF